MRLSELAISDFNQFPPRARAAEWAKLLGVSRQQMWNARRAGTLAAGEFGFGRWLMYDRNEIEEWYKRRLLTPAVLERMQDLRKAHEQDLMTIQERKTWRAELKLAMTLLNLRAAVRRMRVVLEP
jgi:hypothetical protein